MACLVGIVRTSDGIANDSHPVHVNVASWNPLAVNERFLQRHIHLHEAREVEWCARERECVCVRV